MVGIMPMPNRMDVGSTTRPAGMISRISVSMLPLRFFFFPPLLPPRAMGATRSLV